MQTAQQLAATEENYNATLQTNTANITQANIRNQYQNIPAGQNLVNTFANTAINPSMLTAQTGVANYG